MSVHRLDPRKSGDQERKNWEISKNWGITNEMSSWNLINNFSIPSKNWETRKMSHQFLKFNHIYLNPIESHQV